jgi:hypothetical protein
MNKEDFEQRARKSRAKSRAVEFAAIRPGTVLGSTHYGGGGDPILRVIQRVDIKRGSKDILGISKLWFIKCTFINNELLDVLTDRSITYKHWKTNYKFYRIVPRDFFIKKLFSAR